jgi:hypothetical protein
MGRNALKKKHASAPGWPFDAQTVEVAVKGNVGLLAKPPDVLSSLR